jgi:hypothetical protein
VKKFVDCRGSGLHGHHCCIYTIDCQVVGVKIRESEMEMTVGVAPAYCASTLRARLFGSTCARRRMTIDGTAIMGKMPMAQITQSTLHDARHRCSC